MRVIKTFLIIGLIAGTTGIFGQELPATYQPLLNEIVTFFETISGSNSITQGDNTLSVANKEKVALRIEHKKQVKNLIFVKVPDEEGNLHWTAGNELTIDMVLKYEDELTKTLESMHKFAEKKSKE